MYLKWRYELQMEYQNSHDQDGNVLSLYFKFFTLTDCRPL